MAENSSSTSSSSSGDGWWEAAIGAAGSAFSTMSSARSVKQQIAFQQASQLQQQAYAREMSGTAHLREVRDLKQAGLNPILSGTGGMGAPSPMGSGMPGQSMQYANLGAGAASTAFEARRNRAEVGLLNQQRETEWERTGTERANKARTMNEATLRDLELVRQKIRGHAGVWEAEAKADKSSARAIENAAKIESQLDRPGEGPGEWTRLLNRLIPGANSAAGIIRSTK